MSLLTVREPRLQSRANEKRVPAWRESPDLSLSRYPNKKQPADWSWDYKEGSGLVGGQFRIHESCRNITVPRFSKQRTPEREENADSNRKGSIGELCPWRKARAQVPPDPSFLYGFSWKSGMWQMDTNTFILRGAREGRGLDPEEGTGERGGIKQPGKGQKNWEASSGSRKCDACLG